MPGNMLMYGCESCGLSGSTQPGCSMTGSNGSVGCYDTENDEILTRDDRDVKESDIHLQDPFVGNQAPYLWVEGEFGKGVDPFMMCPRCLNKTLKCSSWGNWD